MTVPRGACLGFAVIECTRTYETRGNRRSAAIPRVGVGWQGRGHCAVGPVRMCGRRRVHLWSHCTT